MIPIALSLKNFMCYGENVAPLDFRSFHVACLCGDNGNGKSALLDAITWALWGRARARTDDELVHLGKMDMEVEFEFALGPEQYRVIRKRTRPGIKRTGHSFLDFQISSGDGYRSIAGNSISETERKIIDTLRMDFDTFRNSASLMQGRADEFTKKTPSQRKQVLADILALSLYDDLEERAKSRAREREGRQNAIEGELKSIDEELKGKDQHELELREIAETINTLEAARGKQEERVSTLTRRKNELDVKSAQLGEIESRIKQAKETVEAFDVQAAAHRQGIKRYEAVLQSHAAELDRVRARLGELARSEDALAEKRAMAQQTSNHIHLLRSTNARIEAEGKELGEKIDMLARDEAKCPLCGTELGVEGRESIMANYGSQREQRREQYRANEHEAKKLEGQLKELNREIGELERRLKEERSQCESREAALKRDHAEADDRLPGERQGLERAEDAVKRWQFTIDAEAETRQSLEAELVALPKLEADMAAARREVDDVVGRLARASQLQGSVQEKLKRCLSLETGREERRAELESILRDKELYRELASAFGKSGIQMLIIETALPEIEEEADRLLGRMTDNRMHLKIEPERARKTGKEKDKPIETLDLNISDELGTRRYEMYSGGEAFRIDFALRIALSRLLTRRAGAPLSTLIIDEGFGTQDSTGREKLVEAINSIQDEFDKILVITHIEELKNAFPTRIEVTKTAGGSIIEVN